MKILLIAEGHPREWPILEALHHHFPDTVWLQPVYESSEKREPFFARLGRIYYSLRFRLHRKITKKKVAVPEPAFSEHIQLPWDQATSKGLRLIDELQPDIILACRAPILKPEIINKTQWGSINVHFGILPRYRGNEGLFWALLNGDYDALGGSIHLIDTGIDTGAKLVDAYPALEGSESLVEIETAVSRALAQGLIDCLKKIEEEKSIPEGQPQPAIGRNYRQSERTWVKDLSYLLKRTGRPFPTQQKKALTFSKHYQS